MVGCNQPTRLCDTGGRLVDIKLFLYFFFSNWFGLHRIRNVTPGMGIQFGPGIWITYGINYESWIGVPMLLLLKYPGYELGRLFFPGSWFYTVQECVTDEFCRKLLHYIVLDLDKQYRTFRDEKNHKFQVTIVTDKHRLFLKILWESTKRPFNTGKLVSL